MADFELTGGNFRYPPGMTSFETFANHMMPGMHEVGYLLMNQMADYPPQPAGSTYIRTGTLGRRWTVKVMRVPGMVTTEVGNSTLYAPWVQSHQFQARSNRHWQTDKQVIERNEGNIIAILEARSRMIMSS